jgi:hypothetical protein
MLSKYLELAVKIGMLKFEIRNVMASDLVDEEILNFGKYKEKKRVEETLILALLSVQNKFDVAKYIRFVPPFLEKEVVKDFVHLAKIAKSLHSYRAS